jgi:hypothetical protein
MCARRETLKSEVKEAKEEREVKEGREGKEVEEEEDTSTKEAAEEVMAMTSAKAGTLVWRTKTQLNRVCFDQLRSTKTLMIQCLQRVAPLIRL